MDSAARPPSPDFPPSSQPKPLKSMPQRATPMQGQTWPCIPPQSTPITPSPPTPLARGDGKLPSPPQLGWAKRTMITSSKHTEMEDALPSGKQEGTEVSPNRSPTPIAMSTAATLEHDDYLALIKAQQLITHDALGEQGGRLLATQDVDLVQLDTQLMAWPQDGGHGQEAYTHPAERSGAERPSRKRQRLDSGETPQDNEPEADLLWQLEDPLAAAMRPTQPTGDTPPPYDTIATRASDSGVPPAGHAARVTISAPLDRKGKGRARDEPAISTPVGGGEQVLISIDELLHLRSLAKQNDSGAQQMEDVGYAVPEDHHWGEHAVTHPNREQGIAQPIDIRTALRPPRSAQASPVNSFPLTVDFNDPEHRRLLRELLLSRDNTMSRTCSTTDEMEIDDAGSRDTTRTDTFPPPRTPTGGSTTRLVAHHSGATFGPPATAPPPKATSPVTAALVDRMAGLGLSVPPTGEGGRFPAVQVRSPTDRVRGIPQEALDEFRKLPQGTKMVLEVYGKAQVDRAEATKITRDIEKIIKAATGLEVFALTPPPRPAPSDLPSEVPTAWLLTGITPAASATLARRHGWATPDVAFYAYNHPEPIPTYVFALEGFNQSNTDTAAAIVREEFMREPTYSAIRNLVAANPALNGDVKGATTRILQSVKVVLRREGTSEDSPSMGHVYMESPTLAPDQWTAWRKDLLAKKFSLTRYTLEFCKENIRCDRCHAADHRTAQCEYMHLADWHGKYTPAPPPPPSQQQVTEGQEDSAFRGFRGGGRGPYRGAGGGGPRRGSTMRGRGGKKFAQGSAPRGG
ncbi:hypothetical protein OH77DRAFT_1417370 [Trametes cingulata]|nr:hypothetical protein OH77DRAFT_1417370 [Trametes cingulata]